MKRFTRFLRENWPWKLLSLGAAALLWMAVASEPEMATFIRVPVVYRNAPADLEISSAIENFVRVQATGASGRLRDASAAPLPVVLDLAGVHGPGARTFNLDATDVRLPKGVVFVSAAPAQLHFVFENRLEKKVPVHVQWSGSLPAGERLASSRATPAELTIVGPYSRVKAVEAVSTDPIDLGRLHDGDVVTTTPFIEATLVRFEKFQSVQVKVVLRN